MKKGIYILLLLPILAFIELEYNNCKTKATIVGFDSTKCFCCWGWKLEIDGIVYLAKELPNWEYPHELDSIVTYPISVSVDYNILNEGCSNRIEVSCIARTR